MQTSFPGIIFPEQVNYLKQLGLGGFMIWSLDLDDFANKCGQGKYPLLQAMNDALNGLPL